jgi:hypothetical protein
MAFRLNMFFVFLMSDGSQFSLLRSKITLAFGYHRAPNHAPPKPIC